MEEKLIEKMIFLLFLEKWLLKIEPWKITPDFYNNFFRFRGVGGGDVPVSPPLPGAYVHYLRVHLERDFKPAREKIIFYFIKIRVYAQYIVIYFV